MRATAFILLLLIVVGTTAAREVQPVLNYRLAVDADDTTGYWIQLWIDHAPKHFRLAMATHPEYDDRFWRYVRQFQVTTGSGQGAIVVRSDSAVYDVTIPGSEAIVRYRIQLPRHLYAHRPFLSSSGGLVGDIHSFFYMVGYERVATAVKLELPAGWRVATGLEPTLDSTVWTAPSIVRLMDCPVLVGRLREWHFRLAGIPYTVAYLPAGSGPAFDTVRLVSSIRKIAEQAVGLFGGAPYRHYTFQLIDGVYGALEHANSVTIGAPAGWLANAMPQCYAEIAHEFFHTWNLVSIRPAEYSELNYGVQEQSAALWWSEGVTMYYADLLLRRAGLPVEDSTRRAHLAAVMGSYYADTGNRVFAPSRVSLASNAPPGELGDYSASTHVQGELLGVLLDLLLRSCTQDRWSLDDVMRAMYVRYGGKTGFRVQDIERAAGEVSECPDSVHAFFEDYVYAGKPLNFDRYLRWAGMRVAVGWEPAVDDKGGLLPDGRIYAWQPAGDTLFHLGLTDPRSCWGRAGLHTGDAVLFMDGQAISSRAAFHDVMKRLRVGDTVEVRLRGKPDARVVVTGYSRPRVWLLTLHVFKPIMF